MDHDLILDLENEENNSERNTYSDCDQKESCVENIKPKTNKNKGLRLALISSIALIWAGVFLQGIMNNVLDNPNNILIARTGLLIYASGSVVASISLLLLSIRIRAPLWIRSGGIVAALLLLTWTFLVMYYLAPAVFF